MKHTNKEIAQLKASQLKLCIYEEVVTSFTSEDFARLKTFEKFWNAVDVKNAYEGGWEEVSEQYKPIYEEVYNNLKVML